MTEQRKVRIIMNKAGGTAGVNSLNYRVSLPSKWINALGFHPADRDAVIEFDGQKIVLRKASPGDRQ